ncbi:hypothetical protein [Microbispora sp. GKU 823]|uniref:hypothetical protein n=1 Tax=Microbispora sp. GKU 823 TaxID=1652100 RepID=UPI0015C40F36|nr:hypothetical protein [Microbispora sp. GKU 823]
MPPRPAPLGDALEQREQLRQRDAAAQQPFQRPVAPVEPAPVAPDRGVQGIPPSPA